MEATASKTCALENWLLKTVFVTAMDHVTHLTPVIVLMDILAKSVLSQFASVQLLLKALFAPDMVPVVTQIHALAYMIPPMVSSMGKSVMSALLHMKHIQHA